MKNFFFWPGEEFLFCCLEPIVSIDLIRHRTLSSGDGPLSMSIRCGLLSRLHLLPSVEPFKMSSSFTGQLHGTKTIMGRVVLQFLVFLAGLKAFHSGILKSWMYLLETRRLWNVSSWSAEVLGYIVLKPGGCGSYPLWARRFWDISFWNTEVLVCWRTILRNRLISIVRLAYGAIYFSK